MNFIFHMNVVQSVLKFILTIHIFAMSVLITPKLLIGHGKRQPNKMNTVIVISGRGSNMSALLDHNIKVTAVLSNVPDAPGLKIARNRGIKCIACNAVQEVCDMIEELSPDLVCLAGFMRILPQHITEKFQVMNIHPSLLPRFPGLHAQKQAFESGASYSGCTVHMVDGGVDTGKIIVQKAVPILLNDTVESLSTRILNRSTRRMQKQSECSLGSSSSRSHVRISANRSKIWMRQCDRHLTVTYHTCGRMQAQL